LESIGRDAPSTPDYRRLHQKPNWASLLVADNDCLTGQRVDALIKASNGETISTAFVEWTINQVVSRRFVKKQQMQWTLRGAHLLLQTRTRVLNEDLDDLFRRWYPKFRSQPQTQEPERKAA